MPCTLTRIWLAFTILSGPTDHYDRNFVTFLKNLRKFTVIFGEYFFRLKILFRLFNETLDMINNEEV